MPGSPRRRSVVGALAAAALCAASAAAAAPVAVPLAQYDAGRTGANPRETLLTPATVDPRRFGRVFTREVDDAVYAEPLIVPGVVVAGTPRTLLLTATMGNTVYAFDADDPARAQPYWARHLGPPGDPQPGWIGPTHWGVLGTPVADLATRTLYVVAKIRSADGDELWLHAFDLADGEPKYHSPQRLSFPFAGGPTVTRAGPGIQRAGLLVTDGVLVIAFANIHPEPSHDSQEGFLESFDATDLRHRLAVFQVTPTGLKGGIWQAGRGIAGDDRGTVFVATAGGTYDGRRDFGSSVLRLEARTLALVDWFTPANHAALFHGNLDLSANGVTLIPGTNALFAGGKEGVVYLLDRDRLGQLEGATGPLQRLQASQGCGAYDCSQTLGTAFWSRGDQGLLYVWDRGDRLRGYRFAGGRFETTPFSVGARPAAMTGGPTVSANGTDLDSGIVWAVTTAADANTTPVAGTLRAFPAADLGRELYNSDVYAERDALGRFTKFATPVVANGRVYVPTHSNRVSVYGVLP